MAKLKEEKLIYFFSRSQLYIQFAILATETVLKFHGLRHIDFRRVFLGTFDSVSEGITDDSLFNGDLHCLQTRNGYRFSMDAVLLAHYVNVNKPCNIIDLGTGCGIIMLILLYRHGALINKMVGVEYQKSLAHLAERNLQLNRFIDCATVVQGDVKCTDGFLEPGTFDIAVCNPPFYSAGSGRESLNFEARLARHQILADIRDFLHAASIAVKNKGTAYFVYPATLIGQISAAMAKHRLEIKKLQFVYSYPGNNDEARLVLIECIKNGGEGAKVLAPFYIYQEKNGPLTAEMELFYTKTSGGSVQQSST